MDTATSTTKVTTVDPQKGLNISVVGDTYRILIGGDETGGAFSVIDMLVPPGGGPGPHAHPDFQESFYVTEGEFTVKTKEQTYLAKVGSYVRIPLGGIVHDFKNDTKVNARLLCILVPAGLEKFFEAVGKPVAPDTFLPLDPAMVKKMQEIAPQYGQQVFPPDYLG